MSDLPKDAVMLLSYVNTQLRDYYDSFEEYVKSNSLDGDEIIKKLSTIDYEYNKDLNRFV